MNSNIVIDLSTQQPQPAPFNIKNTISNSSQNNSKAECPICLDYIQSEGEHSLVSTLCGHLFGKSCLIKSFQLKSECPKCRTPCCKRKRKFIVLYDHITTLDTSSSVQCINNVNSCKIQQLEEQLSQEKKNKIKVQYILYSSS
jgi:alpha/beta superfamily hydrolase